MLRAVVVVACIVGSLSQSASASAPVSPTALGSGSNQNGWSPSFLKLEAILPMMARTPREEAGVCDPHAPLAPMRDWQVDGIHSRAVTAVSGV